MIPRNLTLFVFPKKSAEGWFAAKEVCGEASFELGPPTAAEALHAARLKPVGPLEMAAIGFVPPLGGHSPAEREDALGESLYRRVGDCVWVSIGIQQKLLPASVVNAQLAEKLAAIEQREGRRPTARARRRMRDELIAEMLPRALVKPSRIDAWLDLQRGLLVVDTPSRKRAETVASELRRAFGSFPALPVNCEEAPRSVLTSWLVEGTGPFWDFNRLPLLSIGDLAHLADPTDHGTVRIADQELRGEEVSSHLLAGKKVTRLRILLDDTLQVDVGDDMVLRGLRILDGATASIEEQEHDDMAAELDARFALASGLVGLLTDALAEAFRWSKAEG